jgi:hypothetical protein
VGGTGRSFSIAQFINNVLWLIYLANLHVEKKEKKREKEKREKR